MTLKKFEVREMIAKGGMAEVYRAQTVGPEGFAKEVCVKKILPHLTEDSNFVKMFVNEAKLAATLNFANIVQVHDLCVSASHEYFIVMEYVEGKDLSDVIRGAQLAGREVPPDIAVYVAREVAKGLYYAHTKVDPSGAPLNLIHRDISPQNVLVSYMGEVKITDFGIAKASSIVNKTAVGILKGKYGYMSPEQARGERIDARSDIFCLGIVLYELLVGERCFAGASDYSTLNLMREAVVTPPTKINDKVPKSLEAIILKTLSKDADGRYGDALELEGALGKWAVESRQEARSTDLARFMKELFARPPSGVELPSSTGVLDLASVVGPAPTDEAGKEALARLEAKARKSEAPSAGDARVRKSEAPSAKEEVRAKKSEAPPAKDEAKAKKSETPPKDEARAKKSEAPAAKEEVRARKSEAPSAKDKPERPKKAENEESSQTADAKEAEPERKPAKLKPDKIEGEKPDKADKADAKKKAAENKRPVGRRDLKPGATAIQDVKDRGRSFGFGKAIAVGLIAAAAGVAFASVNQRVAAQEGVLRTVEREGASADGLAPLLLESDVPGAKVKVDGKDVPGTTPLELLVTREAHDIELFIDERSVGKKRIELEKSGLTQVRMDVGASGRLHVDTIPSGLPVRVDGQLMGTSPVDVAASSGTRMLALGKPGFERRVSVEIKAGAKSEVREVVPLAHGPASVGIEADPRLEVKIDGRPTGRRADGTPVPLDAGKSYKVSLVNAEGKSVQKLQVKLEPGERRVVWLEDEPKKPVPNK
ncbi:MAG: protein kinase [Deltaproteobacteria bacterium]|nr:protein kinase [Deltaproteobacteria bacterium]